MLDLHVRKTMMISKQHLAIGTLNTVISNWEETYPMLCEHPKLKDELIFIREKLEEKHYKGLKKAENHMYYVLMDTFEVDLAHDLEKILKAIPKPLIKILKLLFPVEQMLFLFQILLISIPQIIKELFI